MCTLLLLVDKPKFLCDHEMYVKVNEPDYNLECKVHANPPVRFVDVTFIDPDDANATADMMHGDYRVSVTAGVSIAKFCIN